jgi:NAD-dependent aldehyde dehydrogenases
MITRKVSPALAAGCTVVLKPANETPLTALALVALAEKAGVPKGVFNILTGNSSAIGKVLCEHPAVRFVGFTGSTEVGKILYQQAAVGVKKLGLELGGNAPFVVFDDADIDAAVEAPWSRSTATWARPASAPTASTPRTRSTTSSSKSSQEGRGDEDRRRHRAA